MATMPGISAGGRRTFATLTVTTAATGLSDVLDCGGLRLSALEMSTAWTDGSITFLGSFRTSANLQNLYTSTGGELTFATTALRTLAFDPAQFSGIRFLQLRSGSSATPVAQAAARTVYVGLA